MSCRSRAQGEFEDKQTPIPTAPTQGAGPPSPLMNGPPFDRVHRSYKAEYRSWMRCTGRLASVASLGFLLSLEGASQEPAVCWARILLDPRQIGPVGR